VCEIILGLKKRGLEMVALKKSGFTREFFFLVLSSKIEDVDQNVMIFMVGVILLLLIDFSPQFSICSR
jgi:hypothetical protein